jgi:DNA-binding response OmpR family regulator
MASRLVLMIDDDDGLCRLLAEYFARFAIRLVHESRIETGMRRLSRDRPDLVILDVMLPDGNGMAACREIRACHALPIIMLTARGETADRVMGLEMGADDYVPKPFEPRELVARVEAALRRLEPARDEVIAAGSLMLDPARTLAEVDGRAVELSGMESGLLLALMRARGRVLSRDQLLRVVHGFDAAVTDRAVDMAISRLRDKLGDDASRPRLIKTIRGAGYQFVG